MSIRFHSYYASKSQIGFKIQKNRVVNSITSSGLKHIKRLSATFILYLTFSSKAIQKKNIKIWNTNIQIDEMIKLTWSLGVLSRLLLFIKDKNFPKTTYLFVVSFQTTVFYCYLLLYQTYHILQQRLTLWIGYFKPVKLCILWQRKREHSY